MFARLAVTFAEPLNDVPVNPVPSVKVPVVLAEIVPEPPKLMEVPLIVILEFARYELGNVAATEVMLAFCNVTLPKVPCVAPRLTLVLPIVTDEFVSPELGMVAFICEGAIEIVVFAAFVSCPCALTVKVPTVLALPYVADVTDVFAILIVPLDVIGPPVKPVPVSIWVTVPLPPPPAPPATFSMDHLRVRHQA